MNGPHGIPYEELAMQQKEAEEAMPYTMREVRAALVKLPPKDRHGIIFALDSGQAEIERLTALIESRDAEIHALYAPVVEALRKIKSRGPIPTHQTDEGLRTRCLSCQYAWDGDEHEEHDPNCAYVIALAAIKEVKG